MRVLITPFLLTSLVLGASVNGDNSPDGKPSQCLLPQEQRLHNVGGSDGAGLCVFTSLTHAARYQGVIPLQDFQQWMRSKPGGGYPEKVDQMIRRLCQERHVPVPRYVQVQRMDLELLALACRTGRMPSITYGVSPSGRYNRQRIAHMVNLVHCQDGHFGILDNNYEREIEWLNREEFVRAFQATGGAWAVILLNPGPPPEPRNE